MATGATVSACAPTTSVGTCRVDQFLVRSQPVSGIAACSDGRERAASSVPPPPIECPTTPSLLLSMRDRTLLCWVR